MQFLENEFKNTRYQYEKKYFFYIFIFEQYCRFLLNLIENSINRQVYFVQEFQNAKQNAKQIAQIFDNHLNYLKIQLHTFTEKQRRIVTRASRCYTEM